jgi:HlyD family secretion protein
VLKRLMQNQRPAAVAAAPAHNPPGREAQMSLTTAPPGAGRPLTQPRKPEAASAPGAPAAGRDGRAPAGPLLFGTTAIVVFFGGFIAWATMAPLAEASIAPGVIRWRATGAPSSTWKAASSARSWCGTAAVKAGQVLMRLDESQSDAALETSARQRWSLQAQDGPAEGRASGARDRLPPDLLAATENPRASEAVVGQRTLFEARQASLASQLQVLDTRVQQQEATVISAPVARSRPAAPPAGADPAGTGCAAPGAPGPGPDAGPAGGAAQRGRTLEGNMEDLRGQVEPRPGCHRRARPQPDRQTRTSGRPDISPRSATCRARLNEAEEKLRAAPMSPPGGRSRRRRTAPS